jgi:hypothetical protein
MLAGSGDTGGLLGGDEGLAEGGDVFGLLL